MKVFPAIALLEIDNIATGIRSGDAMVKKSPIALLKTGTVSHGKYLILVGGSVAAVDEAFREGVEVAGEHCLDTLLLPDVHPRVYEAVAGGEEKITAEALGVLETATLASNIAAADAAIKGAAVRILKMRMGDGYKGKGYTLFNGRVEDVQAAIDIAAEVTERKNVAAEVSIIPLLHESMRRQINASLRFDREAAAELPDGETDVTG